MPTKRIRYARILLFALLTPVVNAACIAIDGPGVPLSALMPYVDGVPTVPMGSVLTSTPDPGRTRWITATELRQWGLVPKASGSEEGICVERRLKPVEPETVRVNVQTALQSRLGGARLLGITSIQPSLFPEGRLSLPVGGLKVISAEDGVCSFLWQAAIEYDAHRLTPIRILGRYQAETHLFVAKHDMNAGDVVGAGDYERIARPGCPHSGAVNPLPPEGSILRQSVQQGDIIKNTMLKPPLAVDEGDVVRVLASAGGASVSIEAVAERPGHRGESVTVLNKASGKHIRVLLTGKGEGTAIVRGAAK